MKLIKGLALLLLLSGLGCPYTLVRERSATLPAGVRSMAVPLARNLTIEAGLEDVFTQSLIQTLRADGRVTILSAESADAELRCTLFKLLLSPQAYSKEGRISIERAVIEAECALELADTGAVVFRTGKLRATEEYPVGNDYLMNEQAKAAAVRQICADLAESVRSLLLDSF